MTVQGHASSTYLSFDMKRILIILCILFGITQLATAKKEDNRLRTHETTEGTLYYVGQKKLKGQNKQLLRELDYDMTLLMSQDSVTINFTVLSSSPADVTALTLSNATSSVAAHSVALLYHDISGKYYEIRSTSRVHFQELKALMQSDLPLHFSVMRADGSRGDVEYSASEWKKERSLFNRILYLINK